MPDSKIEELEQEIQNIKDTLNNSGIGNENKLIKDTELNNLSKTGFFYVNNCTIAGNVIENGYLISLIYVNSYKMQIYTNAYANSTLKIRKCVNNQWTEFTSI